MKNILIYTGLNKQFDEEHSILVKIQIDNSFDLGWKSQDIILVTDFAYQYNGIKSLIVRDGLYYDFDKNANKAIVLVHLLKEGIINTDDLYWCHDFDSYELNKISEEELELKGYDLGLTHYFYKPQWQFGSVFFTKKAKDIFELLDKSIRRKPHSSRNNEKTLTRLINDNAIDNSRFKKLNVRYNFMKRYQETVFQEAIKPLKVLHFHPYDFDELMPDTALNMFMYGKNSLGFPLMNERLIKIFNYHGIK